MLIGPEQLIQFERAEIKLDIPKEGITLKEGWKIIPLVAPVVRTIVSTSIVHTVHA